MKALRAKQKLGKYIIERKLAEGGFSVVYQARDMIEGIRVALKIPHAHLLTGTAMEDFRKEVRLVARLEHPHILPLKNAQFIDEFFVIVSASGLMTLEDRIARRLPFDTAMDYATQMLAAVSYAHSQRIIHCDIKPDNFILFENNRLRLTDFGVSKVAQATLRASGAGTLGYMAPEQAMGRPSYRSDVFALGLVLYRMFSGHLPEYPFVWPPPGLRLLQQKVHPGLISLLRKSIELAPPKRFADAQAMQAAFARVRKHHGGRAAAKRSSKSSRRSSDWKDIQRKQFLQEFGKALDAHHECQACHGPVSEAMQACPWCGKPRLTHEGDVAFPQHCPRCARHEARLALLRVVLRPQLRALQQARVQRPSLHRALSEPGLHAQSADAVHALLPVVPPQSAAQVENRRLGQTLSPLRLGRGGRLLEPLPLVFQATWRRINRVAQPRETFAMECQQLAPHEARTYLNADMLEPEVFELAGGTVAVLTSRRPEKATANEDAAAVIAARDGAVVLVVADGCGGMANGQEAARIAVETLALRIAAEPAEGPALRAAVLDAVEAANRQILDLKAGAGATLAVVHLENGEIRPYHVGDSQILLVGNRGKIKLLTTSHSPVGYALESGMLEEEEAMDHDERHLVSNYLGSEAMHVEVGSGRKFSNRDGLLIASDGVLDNLLLDELVDLLRTGSAVVAARKIAGLARQRMESAQDGKPHKPDDLTLIVFTQRGVRRPAPPAASVTPRSPEESAQPSA